MGLSDVFSFERREHRQRVKRLYDGLMRAALSPDLYETGVARDDFDGRFEQVSLHSILLMRRLRAEEADGRVLAEQLYERVFSGFDYALRETGVGDTTISRKVRALGERFFGLARAIDEALEAAFEDRLLDVLVRNGLCGGADKRLARYLRHIDDTLARQSGAEIMSASVNWPALKR